MRYVWYKLIQFIARQIALPLGIRVFGQGNIPTQRGALIASNHQSYLDPMLLGLGIRRPIYYLARQDLFEATGIIGRLFRILISSLNAIPLERKHFNTTGIREAINKLKEGELVVIFPEGSRSFDGKIGPIKPGMMMLARQAKVPIIPAGISGAFKVWSRHTSWPVRWYPIRVKYGHPILFQDTQTPEALSQEIYRTLQQLS